MTLTEIRERVSQIAACADDNEVAHSMEDDLYRDVLAFIAQGNILPEAWELAREALKAKDIDYVRWYA